MATTTNYDIVDDNRSDDRDTITTYVFNPTATMKSFSLGGNSDGDTIAIDALSSDFKVKVKNDTMTLIGLKNTPSAGVIIKIQLDNIDAAGGASSLAFLDGTVDVSFVPKVAGSLKGAWTFGGVKVSKALNLSKNVAYTIDGDNTYADLDIAAQRELNGQTFTLTNDLDQIPGMIGSKGTTSTTGHDTILGVHSSTNNTLNMGDAIDGGEGNDLLRVITDQSQVSLIGVDVQNVEQFRLESNSDDFDGLELDNIAFEEVTVDFKNRTEADGMPGFGEDDLGEDYGPIGSGINDVNKGSKLNVQNVDLLNNRIDINYAGAGAINNSLSLTNVKDGAIAIDFNHPLNEAETEEIAGGEYTINLDEVEDLAVYTNEGGAAILNVNVKGDSTGVYIGNNGGFAEDQNATVNLRLDANLTGADWDLADLSGDGQLTINISGAGNLTIHGMDDSSAKTLVNGGSAQGDLDIDFEEKSDLSAVTTGSGDDRVVVERRYFDAVATAYSITSIALGSGSNILGVNDDGGNDSFNAAEISELDFTKVAVTGAGTLELVDDVYLLDDATLTLKGINSITSVDFSDGVDGEDGVLALRWNTDDETTLNVDESLQNAPDSFKLTGTNFDDFAVDTGSVKNLTIEGSDTWLDVDGIVSEKLENLTVKQTAATGTPMTSVTLDATDGSTNAENLNSLKTVNVDGGLGTSTLTIAGDPGFDSDGDSGDVERFEILVTDGFQGGAGTKKVKFDFEGITYDREFTIPDNNGSYSTGAVAEFIASKLRESGYMGDLLNGVAALTESEYTAGDYSDELTVANNDYVVVGEWRTAGGAPDLLGLLFTATNPTKAPDNLGEDEIYIEPGEEPDPGEEIAPTSGFGNLQTVKVYSEQVAHADIQYVSGSFALDVESTKNDADVYVLESNIVSAVVKGKDDATAEIDQAGDLGAVQVTATEDDAEVTISNSSVTTLTVSAGDEAEVYLSNLANLTSLTVSATDDGESINGGASSIPEITGNYVVLDRTIKLATVDLSGIVDNDGETADLLAAYVAVDASTAEFTSTVTIKIGGADLYYVNDTLGGALSTGGREIFEFVGSDIGTVIIEGFTLTGGELADRIDLSAFGINGDNVAYDDVENYLGNPANDGVLIVAGEGSEFTGSILLVGITRDALAGVEAQVFI